jgi:hypothetical protein
MRCAAGRLEQGAQHADRGGLPRAVRAKQAEYLTAFDLDIDPLDGGKRGFWFSLPKLPALLFWTWN